MKKKYLKSARVVNGSGKYHYFQCFLVVRVNQIQSCTCRDVLNIAILKVVRVSVVGVLEGKYGSPCD